MASRLLFIQPSLDAVGGIEKVVPVAAEDLAKSGAEVSALSFYGSIPREQAFWSKRFEQGEAETRSLIDKIAKVFRRAKRIRAAARDTNATGVIVSAQGAIVIVLCLKLFGFIRVPVVAYVHEARGDGGYFYRLLTGLIYPLASGWICVSDGILEEIRRIPFVDPDLAVRAHNALGEEKGSQEVAAGFESLPRPIFISAGRFERAKGADLLARSFISYFKDRPGTLVLLGSGSLENEIREAIAAAGMEERIQLFGRVDNPRAYMRKADVYVSLARSEPFGLALIEALSVGLPVVATDAPSGPREILSPTIEPKEYPFRGQHGVLLPPPDGSNSALTEAVKMLEENPYDRGSLVSRASDFSRVAQHQAIAGLLKKLSI